MYEAEKTITAKSDSVVKVMGSQVKRYWANATNYQKLLYTTGFLLLASAIFHSGVLVVTGGALEGDVSFRKAITFGEAFGLTAVSLAWFLSFLPKKPALWWPLAGVYAVATFVEVFLTTMQVWRGVSSHFNNMTPFDASVFALMGVSIGLHIPLIIGVLVASFFFIKVQSGLKWSIRGAMLIFIAAQIFGIFMIVTNSNTVAPAGYMKGPHAVALHALQVLPGLAFLLTFTSFKETKQTRLVALGVASYAGLTAVVAFQAMSGLATFDLSVATGVLFVLSTVALIFTLVRTVTSLRRPAA